MNTAQQPQKILIRLPNWFGDLVMATAFIQAIGQTFPKARVDLILPQKFLDLPLPQSGKRHGFRNTQELFVLSWQLRKEKYNLCFVLPPSFSSALSVFLTGSKERLGYSSEGRSCFLSKTPSFPFSPRTKHLIEEYLFLLSPNLDPKEYKPQLLASPEFVAKHFPVQHFQSKKPFVVIAPGALYGKAKQWPPEFYARLGEGLLKAGYVVVLTGGVNDRESVRAIQKKIPSAIDLAGKTSLNAMIALLTKSDLLISNDSGAMHAMTALQKPQIAIFGSTSPIWTGPRNRLARVIGPPLLDCTPCFQKTCRYGHYHCLTRTDPESVLQKALAMLKEK